MLYFEQKTGQFFPVVGNDKYFPLNLEAEPVAPQSGDTITFGTQYGINKLAADAERQSGSKLVKIGDVTFCVQ